MPLIHADLPPFRALLRREYLYDMDPEFVGQTEPCVVFGVSSYADRALTVQVLLGNGSMFSYIPVVALGRPAEQELELHELLPQGNCPGEVVVVTAYAHLLTGPPVDAYVRTRDQWVSGEYIATVDWPDQNEQLHLVVLENGQLGAFPNHKLKFMGGSRSFEPYRKLRREWRVVCRPA